MREPLVAIPEVQLPDLDLPYEDGEPLESDRHVTQVLLCIRILRYAWRDRSDFFVGGNMFIKELYEQVFRTPEYFCWDPFDPQAFVGWRLSAGRYTPIPPDERGWLWSEELKLWLGPWAGAIQGEEEAEAERQARLAAEQRVQALEAELARLRGKRGRSPR